MMKNNELIEKMVDAFIEEGTNELFATLVEALIDTSEILTIFLLNQKQAVLQIIKQTFSL